MKNIPIYLIVGFIIVVFIVINVNIINKGVVNKPKEQQIKHGDIVYRNFSTIITRIVIENHTYLFVQGDSNAIIHAESCPCKSINKWER